MMFTLQPWLPRTAAVFAAAFFLVPARAQAPAPMQPPQVLTPPPDAPVVTPPPAPVETPLPQIVVVLADSTAASWLSSAGFSVVTVNEASLPSALPAAAVAIIPVHEVRQTATVDALKAFAKNGGKVFGSYWGPVGVRTPVQAGLSELFQLRVTGWSGKGNLLIAGSGQGRPLFNHTGRLRLPRGFSVVATPVVPPLPPPPAPVITPAPAAASPGAAAKPKSTTPPARAPAVKPVPPPPPPPPAVYAAGKWITDAGKPLRQADAAVIAGPSTLWIGENIFAPGNGTPDVRRWFAGAVVSLAPSLRLAAKQSVLSTAETRLAASRIMVNDALTMGVAASLPDAQMRLAAAQTALAAASAENDYQNFLRGLDSFQAALLDAAAHTLPSRPVEIRAVWIEQSALSKSRDDIRRLVQKLADARFNILLPEVVYRGRAAYPSAVYSQDPRLSGSDPLRMLIEEARRVNLEVHPWVWTLAVGADGDQGPLLRKSPEWAARDRAGRIMSDGSRYFWLSPSVSPARAAVRNIIREIVSKYDVDGVHIDHLRYENPWWDYSDPARNAYRSAKSVDPLTISSISQPWVDWSLWREDLVNSLLREIRDDVRSIKPRVSISAAVLQSPEDARRDALQNWAHWATVRSVDWLSPTMRTADEADLKSWLSAGAAATEGKVLFVPGLTNAVVQDPFALMNHIMLARRSGAQGIALYSATQLSDDLLRALKLGPFRTSASLPWRDPAQAVRALAKASADSLRQTGSPNADQVNAARNAAQSVDAYAGGSDLAWLAANAPLHELQIPFVNEPRYDEARSLLDSARRIAAVSVAPSSGAPDPSIPAFLTPVANPLPLPSVRIPVGAGIVTVDGRLDESVWGSSVKLSLDRTTEGDIAPVATSVRVLRDASTLYLGFECAEPDMANLRAGITGKDNPVYRDDSIELLINTSGQGLPWRRFTVGAGAGIRDDQGGDVRWNARWSAAVTRGDSAWTVEMAIPFAALGGPPATNATWKANLARHRHNGTSAATVWAVPYGSLDSIDRLGTWSF